MLLDVLTKVTILKYVAVFLLISANTNKIYFEGKWVFCNLIKNNGMHGITSVIEVRRFGEFILKCQRAHKAPSHTRHISTFRWDLISFHTHTRTANKDINVLLKFTKQPINVTQPEFHIVFVAAILYNYLFLNFYIHNWYSNIHIWYWRVSLRSKYREGIRSALFWNITELEWLIPYQRFRTKCRSIIQVSLPLKTEPISWPEAWVRCYESTLRYDP
jgi:hypothetical protein